MKKYEYLTFGEGVTDHELTKLGLQGWLLVAHTAVLVPKAGSSSMRISQQLTFVREINQS